MDALNTRISEVRPDYIATARVAELANFASFNDGLLALPRFIERPLDEPPADAASSSPPRVVSEPHDTRDPEMLRYCMKVGFCSVIGYIIGISAQRPELS